MLYIVVRHKRDSQKYLNDWSDDELILKFITTTPKLAKLCEDEMEHGRTVAIYRCSYGDHQASITCTAKIKKVYLVTGKPIVEFENQEVLLNCNSPEPAHTGLTSFESPKEPYSSQKKVA